MRTSNLKSARLLWCAGVVALPLLLAACGSGKSSVLPTPAPALAPTLTPSAVATQTGVTATPGGQATPASTGTPTALPSPSASGTPFILPITLTPVPQLSNDQLAANAAPCKIGQLKGNQTTKNFYLPGLPGYDTMHANVQCFDSIDSAQAAGYHLPGQGG